MIQFPDISQYTPVPLAGAPVALARATIGTVTDTHWASNVADAATHGVPLFGYCFLNAGSLGPSPEEQADYAYQVVGGRPVMLDHEPNRGACATIGEACRWIDRFRYRGGVVYLHYLPHWAWSGTMGSPGLQPLADRRMRLVASNYTTYSDSGPGWAPYYANCPVPVVQWQFADNHMFNGVAVDWNAYRGTVAEYLTIAGGGLTMGTASWPEQQTALAGAAAVALLRMDGTIDLPGSNNNWTTDASGKPVFIFDGYPFPFVEVVKEIQAKVSVLSTGGVDLDALAQKVAALLLPALTAAIAPLITTPAATVDELARRLGNG